MAALNLMHAEVHANLDRMVAIQVRDVPEGIRDDLARAARSRGQSLQVFLREVLETEARKSRNREFLRGMTPVPVTAELSGDEIAALIRRGREAQDGRITDALSGS